MKLILVLIMAALLWCQGIKPIIADVHWLAFKKGDKTALANALYWSPNDTQMVAATGDMLRAIYTNNGDSTAYGLWFNIAVQQANAGSKAGCITALNKSLWYYPEYEPAVKSKSLIDGNAQK